MRVANLKRWHWILIALVFGVAGGFLAQSSADLEDQLDKFGRLIPSRPKFESMLTGQVDGLRQAKDVTVYPYWVAERGGKRLVHIVAAKYWDGQMTERDGRTLAVYKPVCFLARVPFADAPTPGGTVMDYLNALQPAGVTYRYAWWSWMLKPMTLWVAGCLVVIGGVWPTVVNLLAFGTLTRPRDEEGISLFASGPAPSVAPPKQAPSPVLSIHLTGLEQELESHLHGGGDAGDTGVAAPAAVKTLSAAPLAPVTAPSKEDKEYAVQRDDYYPTEVHRPHGKG